MKMWKKLMVFAVSILLISAILAAQYVSVTTSVILSVDTQEAGLQIGAGDPSVDGSNEQQYLLEYDGTDFTVNLGTWGQQNEFTSTAAFFIANAMPGAIRIVGVEVSGGQSAQVPGNVNITLHGSEHGATLDPADNGTTWIAAEFVSTTEFIELIGEEDAYEDEDQMKVTGADPAYATLVEYETGNAATAHWVLPPGETFTFEPGAAGTNSAVWVRISVEPNADIEADDLVLRFLTEDVDP